MRTSHDPTKDNSLHKVLQRAKKLTRFDTNASIIFDTKLEYLKSKRYTRIVSNEKSEIYCFHEFDNCNVKEYNYAVIGKLQRPIPWPI